jgi:elongation factor Ts
MSDISAAMVMELRKMSGQGMMDCKKALQETDGDVEKAMDLLRKKGLATLAKRAGRDTSEGLVVRKNSEDDKTSVLATLCCETDFVAKSDDSSRRLKRWRITPWPVRPTKVWTICLRPLWTAKRSTIF